MDSVLIPASDKLLSESLPKFDFSNPPTDPIQLAYDLVAALNKYTALGLSASQIGLPYRVFIITGEPPYVCFNPLLVDQSPTEVYMEEGCLSYPNTFVKIKRPDAIKVRFALPTGQITTQKFDGMTARVFQHELDHMNGINFLQRATSYHREQALNRAKKLNRKQKNAIKEKAYS